MSRNTGDFGRVRPVVPPTAGRGLPATEQRTLSELVAMNDPLNPNSGQAEALARDGIVVPLACAHCRQLNGHSPLCPTRFQDLHDRLDEGMV